MKIKEQTRKLAVGCSKQCFEVMDRTDEVSNIYTVRRRWRGLKRFLKSIRTYMEVVMDNIIDVSIPVAEVVDKHPEVLEILVELGFKPLANPLMRNTVGRKVSLKQGSKLEGTPMDKIVRTLEANGYEVIGLD